MSLGPVANNCTTNYYYVDTNTGIVNGPILSPNALEPRNLSDNYSTFSDNSLNLLPRNIFTTETIKQTGSKTHELTSYTADTTHSTIGCTMGGPVGITLASTELW